MVALQQNFFAGPLVQPGKVLHGFSGFECPGNVAGDNNAVFRGDGFIPTLRQGVRVVEPSEAFHGFLARRGQVQVSNSEKVHGLFS